MGIRKDIEQSATGGYNVVVKTPEDANILDEVKKKLNEIDESK
jgi:hypothetical protein